MNFTYEPLTEKQVEAIHQATLDVLWECGAEMNHPEILKILKNMAQPLRGTSSKSPRTSSRMPSNPHPLLLFSRVSIQKIP